MSETKWTTEQQDAIDDRGHNLLVSAAAGSGKTAVLVERILGIIKKGEASIDEMLIATFTNAAASEMREKILKRLQEDGLDEQIEKVGHASIGSLDSFAYSVVKRYYHIIGVEPGLRVCDGTSSALLKEDALDDLFEKKFADKDKDFLFFLDCYDSSESNDDSVRRMILNLHNFLMSMPDPKEYSEKACSGEANVDALMSFAQSRALSMLGRAVKYHEQFVSVFKQEKLDKLADKAAIDLEYTRSLYELMQQDPEKAFALVLDKPKAQTIIYKKTVLEPRADEIKSIRQHATDLLKNLKENYGGINRETLKREYEVMLPAIKILFDLVWQFDDIYKQKKSAEKSVDFSDLSHYALQILRDDEVCEEYRTQYKFIFIDEFQDTNSLQEAIIKRIARDDNLFMVGDVKQCIYQFRLAEPSIFVKHYSDYKTGSDSFGKVIDLNKNFRSKQGVIDSVNEVFAGLMTEDSCGMEYDDAAALKKGSSYDGPIEYQTELRILDMTDTENDDELIAELGKAELEALHVASIIKEYHGKIIHDDKNNIDRPLEYKDMVVLLRGTRSCGEVYYRALLNADIPVYLDRSEGYFDSMEIQVFLNLLKLISNSKQDIPLLSVLCCPVFGFTSDELAAARIYGNEVLQKPKAAFYEVFYEYAKLNQKAADFVTLMSQYRKESHIMPLAEFIYKILLNTGYGDFASAQNNGEQKLANLKALVTKAEKYEKDNLDGLAGFIRFAEILAKSSKNIDIGPAKTISESADCVRIMTIHKSKGLEFPLVITADLVGAPLSKSESSQYAFHKELGMALRPVNPVTHAYSDTSFLNLIKLKKQLETRAEEIRILYVAFTRAIDILVLTAAKKKAKNDSEKDSMLAGDIDSASYHLDLIYPCINKASVKRIDKNKLAAFVKQSAEMKESFRSEIEKLGTEAPDKKVLEILNYPYFDDNQPPKKKYSVSELAEKVRLGEDTYTVSTGEEYEYYYDTPKFIADSDHKLSSSERGTAYHKVMEHIPFREVPMTLSEINAFVDDMVSKKLLSELEAQCINPIKVQRFLESDIAKRAAKSRELHKEAPFVMKHIHEGFEILVQGTIDCYFEEDGKYVLIDYKSNYVDRNNIDEEYERLKANYMPQLMLYKEALEKITGKSVKEGALYLFGTDELLTLTV